MLPEWSTAKKEALSPKKLWRGLLILWETRVPQVCLLSKEGPKEGPLSCACTTCSKGRREGPQGRCPPFQALEPDTLWQLPSQAQPCKVTLLDRPRRLLTVQPVGFVAKSGQCLA